MARILIIDECPAFRAWARRVLGREGLEVIEAGDAVAGLQRSVEDRPDLVVVSETLPGIEGIEMTARIGGETAARGTMILMSRDLPEPVDASVKGQALAPSDLYDHSLIDAIKAAGGRGLVERSFVAQDLLLPVREALCAAGLSWSAPAEGTAA